MSLSPVLLAAIFFAILEQGSNCLYDKMSRKTSHKQFLASFTAHFSSFEIIVTMPADVEPSIVHKEFKVHDVHLYRLYICSIASAIMYDARINFQ